MQVNLAYAATSQITDSFITSAVDFATNLRRPVVDFHGRVKEPFLFRQVMGGLYDVVVGDFRWSGRWTYDPVITVHPDQIFLEAFSQDESAYARLTAPMEAFEVQDTPVYGTTNIDFTQALRSAMHDLRSSRQTYFTVGDGLHVETQMRDQARVHHEEKAELPNTWLRGFLQVQGAMMIRPFLFEANPVELLSAIHYIIDNNARKPPRGMRYEFRPNEPISVVLEPWNERFVFQDTHYKGYERTVRVWGRKRLELLLNILPYADRVTVGLLGRGLPHFYICHVGNYQFALVLSGWVRNDWATSSAFDLMMPQRGLSDETIAQVYNFLVNRLVASREEIAAHILVPENQIDPALFYLCRAGLVMADPAYHRFRSRDLFGEPINLKEVFKPHPHFVQADNLIECNAVEIERVFPSDTRKHEIKVMGKVQDQNQHYHVLVAVDLESRIRFAQCQCPFFQDNIMSQGPCPHILAVWFAAKDQLQEFEDSTTIEGQERQNDTD